MRTHKKGEQWYRNVVRSVKRIYCDNTKFVECVLYSNLKWKGNAFWDRMRPEVWPSSNKRSIKIFLSPIMQRSCDYGELLGERKTFIHKPLSSQKIWWLWYKYDVYIIRGSSKEKICPICFWTHALFKKRLSLTLTDVHFCQFNTFDEKFIIKYNISYKNRSNNIDSFSDGRSEKNKIVASDNYT